MVRLNPRVAINVMLTALSICQVLMLIFRHRLGPVLDELVPITTFLTALGLVGFWYQQKVSANRTRIYMSQREQLRQEVRALNKHALVCLTDIKCRIIYVNEAFLRATGYAEDELLGVGFEVLHFDEDQEALAAMRTYVSTGDTWQGENRLRKKDGGELWTNLTFMPGLNAAGERCGSIAVRTDITDVKNLQADKEVFEALSSIRDQIFVFGTRDLVCKYANNQARKHLPVATETGQDVRIDTINPIFDDDTFRNALHQVVEHDADLVQFPLVAKGRSFEAQLQRLSTKSGSSDALLVLRDVTDQVEAERVRTEFISTVSHELRSPMTSIKGSLGLILAGSAGEIPATARHMLEIAHRNSDRLIHIINDLLDIEKIAAGKMSFELGTYDLGSIVSEAILANEGYSKRFDVSIHREGDPQAFVMVDFERTLQVINNLLSNATKFSKPGGKVILRLQETAEHVTLEVQDFGKGIPLSFQKNVFEKFAAKQTASDAEIRGSGLGLAIVKAIVEQQSGKITFDSTEGVGTTFRVEFPAAGTVASGGFDEAIERAAQ